MGGGQGKKTVGEKKPPSFGVKCISWAENLGDKIGRTWGKKKNHQACFVLGEPEK